MNKVYLKRVFAALVVFLAAMPMFAADGTSWSVGKIQTVIKGGEVDNAAGMVFSSPVALTSEADIAAAEGFYQADPVSVTGNLYGPDTNKEWFFYVKPNAGYKFIGFASSATGNPSGSNLAEKLAMVGDYYTVSAKTGSPYKEYSQEAPKVLTRYAVFEKETTGGEGGEGGQDPVLTNIKAIGALYPKVVAQGEGDQTTGIATYVNLVGATLVANGTESHLEGDEVTHIYVQFDDELAYIGMAASQTLASQISLINTSNGRKINFNAYNCVVWSKDNKSLDLMISSENYINSLDFQGVYEFKLPAGVVKSAKGAVNDAYQFTFTYGDPSQAQEEVIIDLADYVGVWKQKKEVGETVENPASFYVEKIGESYYMTHLYGDDALNIPIINDNNSFTLAATSANGYSFGTMYDGAVGVKFTVNGSSKAIMVDQFKYVAPGKDVVYGGECGFTRSSEYIPTGISSVENTANNQMFDLQGRRVATPTKGLYIINGKKYIVK